MARKVTPTNKPHHTYHDLWLPLGLLFLLLAVGMDRYLGASDMLDFVVGLCLALSLVFCGIHLYQVGEKYTAARK